MRSGRYFLNPAVHWRFVHHLCIALDVEKDRYVSIQADRVKPLLEYLQQSPVSAGGVQLEELPADLVAPVPDLIDAGILTLEERPPHCGASHTIPRPTRLVPQGPPYARGYGVRLVFPQFLTACITADYRLRHQSLSRILCCPAVRSSGKFTGSPADAMRMATGLASTFVALRPFYPRRYRCMFDSLALLEFLRRWQISSRWVFGVSVDPFQAHCWVQHDDVVLCDTRDFSARRFTPIMFT